ncbi:MAG: hypothetical protein AAF206_28265 [Bacteroidota bacterium]
MKSYTQFWIGSLLVALITRSFVNEPIDIPLHNVNFTNLSGTIIGYALSGLMAIFGWCYWLIRTRRQSPILHSIHFLSSLVPVLCLLLSFSNGADFFSVINWSIFLSSTILLFALGQLVFLSNLLLAMIGRQ